MFQTRENDWRMSFLLKNDKKNTKTQSKKVFFIKNDKNIWNMCDNVI